MRPKLVALIGVPVMLAFSSPAEAVTNPQVPGLQVALRAKGFYRGPIDGIAGPMTAHAVRAFQRRARITVDGIAGPITRKKLGKLGRPLFGNRRVIARGMIGWDVSVLEFFLSKRGLLRLGRVDGRFDLPTEKALRRYQRRRHLVVDGVAGRQTLRSFGVRVGPSRPRHARPKRSVQVSLSYWARHYRVNTRLVRALAWTKSGFRPNARSSSGAWGVMQVTPSTWRYVENIVIGHHVQRTSDGNVRVGVAYLHQLLHEFGGRRWLALAAYNQGPAAVRRYGLYRETRRFVRDVLALKARRI
jgi:hypothetical protein